MPHFEGMPKDSIERRKASTGILLVAAALIFIGSMLVTAWLMDDATPLLTSPRPDFRLPLSLAGIAAGFFTARWIARLPVIREGARRWAFFVLLPVVFGTGLASAGERIYELVSFSEGRSTAERAGALVIEKSQSDRRFGEDRYRIGVSNPFDERRISLEVNRMLFERVEPHRHCVTLVVERAPNGAARLIELSPAIRQVPSCFSKSKQ